MSKYRQTLIWSLAIFVVWGLFALAPLWPILNPAQWTKTHLIIATNEAEARPCGGFASAYAVVRALPPRFEFANVYALPEHDLGPAPEPLDQVAGRLRFWDVGIETDLNACAAQYAAAFEQITATPVDRVVLLDIGTLESVLRVLGGVKIDGVLFTEKTAFAHLTRAVADVDRHSEEALAERKSSLSQLARQIVQKTILQPWHWRRVAKMLWTRIDAGQLYVQGVTQSFATEDAWALIEWNLGGGKTSHVLDKQLQIEYREVQPSQWEARWTVTVRHLGSYDQPLSQDYNGVLALQMPLHLEEFEQVLQVQLQPGETFQASGVHPVRAHKKPLQQVQALQLLSARGQVTHFDVSFSPMGQTVFLATGGHVLHQRHTIDSSVATLDIQQKQDRISPFVTLHTHVSTRPDFTVEVHFNEPISVTEFDLSRTTLTDMNHSHAVLFAPELLEHRLLPDRRTLLLRFTAPSEQVNERFALDLQQVSDVAGNPLTTTPHTVIYRP